MSTCRDPGEHANVLPFTSLHSSSAPVLSLYEQTCYHTALNSHDYRLISSFIVAHECPDISDRSFHRLCAELGVNAPRHLLMRNSLTCNVNVLQKRRMTEI